MIALLWDTFKRLHVFIYFVSNNCISSETNRNHEKDIYCGNILLQCCKQHKK
jgi:hypothetical protein